MKKFTPIAFAVVAALGLAGCSTTERAATAGAATGAVIGGVTTGTATGALVGGAVGAVAGAVVGRVADSDTQCYYRDRFGDLYIDECPRG